jgi:hypothetical protein
MKWDEVRSLHASAVESFASMAAAIDDVRWHEPRAAGSWSPAEITEHLTMAYDVLLRELAGGEGMRVRTKWWQRLVLRVTVLPKLLGRGVFPKGVRAPRELRPTVRERDRTAALSLFRESAAAFEIAVEKGRSGAGRTTVTHPFFGTASVERALLFNARHVEHHRRQLTGT